MADQVYYENQTAWQSADYYALWRYFDRLVEYVGPTEAPRANPGHHSARIQAKKMHVRDGELATLDPSHMSTETRCLLRAVFMSQGRYELALKQFPNLQPLENASRPAQFTRFDQYPSAVPDLIST